jgi:hypothetical protein
MLAATVVAIVPEGEDNMNIIQTPAPIPIDNLKKYFEDKNTFYKINYADSKLKGSKLLTYLSNLDLPCDIDIDTTSAEFKELLLDYLHHPLIVNIPILELSTIGLLHEFKGLNNFGYSSFIEQNIEIIRSWTSKLDSLSLYNMYVINSPEFKDFVMSHPINEDNTTVGINFVSLLKHEYFYKFFDVIDQSNLQVYKAYYDQNMFKGNNLYSFWANENNPMFILTRAIAEGEITGAEYSNAVNQTITEMENVSPI